MATVLAFVAAGALMGASIGLLSGVSYVILKHKVPESSEGKPQSERTEAKPPEESHSPNLTTNQQTGPFYRPPAAHRPRKQVSQPDSKALAPIPHPVLSITTTNVSHTPDTEKGGLNFNIVATLYNSTDFETTALVDISICFNGVELPPHSPSRTLGVSPKGSLRMALNPTLTESSSKLFTEDQGQGNLSLRIRAEYDDRGKTTIYYFEGLAHPNTDYLDVIKSEWTTKSQ